MWPLLHVLYNSPGLPTRVLNDGLVSFIEDGDVSCRKEVKTNITTTTL